MSRVKSLRFIFKLVYSKSSATIRLKSASKGSGLSSLMLMRIVRNMFESGGGAPVNPSMAGATEISNLRSGFAVQAEMRSPMKL